MCQGTILVQDLPVASVLGTSLRRVINKIGNIVNSTKCGDNSCIYC